MVSTWPLSLLFPFASGLGIRFCSEVVDPRGAREWCSKHAAHRVDVAVKSGKGASRASSPRDETWSE
jgi:hypothetical protein